MITRQKLWRTSPENLLRLARWLRARGDIRERLCACGAVDCMRRIVDEG